jgi:PhnB protein
MKNTCNNAEGSRNPDKKPTLVAGRKPNGKSQFKQQSNIKMKNTHIQPYLFFGGRCEEAIAFYRTALGAQVDLLMHYKDSPEPQPPGMIPPGLENKVMHVTFRIGGTTLMASDGCAEGSSFDGFSLSLATPTETEANRAFAALEQFKK